jgi:micrococcal nuclease
MRWLPLLLLLVACWPDPTVDDDETPTDDDDAASYDPSDLASGEAPAAQPMYGEVDYVIDGDTFEVVIGGFGERVRVLSINTPEMNHGETWGPDCWAEEATERAEELLPEGETVWLTFDGEYSDGFGRLLAYVFVGDSPTETSIEGSFNYLMVREGHGWTFFFDNNRTFEEPLLAAEAQAQGQGLGLWSCP